MQINHFHHWLPQEGMAVHNNYEKFHTYLLGYLKAASKAGLMVSPSEANDEMMEYHVMTKLLRMVYLIRCPRAVLRVVQTAN